MPRFSKRPRRFVVVIVVSFSSTVVREMVFLLFQKKERSFLSPEAMLKRGDSEWIIDFPPYASLLDNLHSSFLSFLRFFCSRIMLAFALPFYSNVRVR